MKPRPLTVNKEALQALDKKITDDKKAISKQLNDMQEKQKVLKQEIEADQMDERIYKEKNNLIQLDFWANCQRGVPNSMLRGCLFSGVKTTEKSYLRELLFENDSIKIVFSGHKLRQSDMDVWETILHLARMQALGNKIDTTEYNLLKVMGIKGRGKENYERLRDSIAKLGTAWVEITHDGLTYRGHLIGDGVSEESTERLILKINPAMARLYEGNRATWLQWDERQKIGQSPMAKWLHGYISSHAKWYPHKVETLKKYSGSEADTTPEYKKTLISALKRLEKRGLILSYRIDEKDLVYIERNATDAQKRHIDGKNKEYNKVKSLQRNTRA
jgi:hypothetical protein